MTRKHSARRKIKSEPDGGDGFLGGLTALIEKLGALAEKGQGIKGTGESRGIEPTDQLRGVYGFAIRSGLGGQREAGKVERLGNVRQDETIERLLLIRRAPMAQAAAEVRAQNQMGS